MYIIKECTKCKEYKLLEEFNKRVDGPFGFRSDCKACIKKRGELYREKNKEVLQIRKSKYYEKNKGLIHEKAKKYRDENKGLIQKRSSKYYEKNKGLILEKNRKYHEQNKELRNQYLKQRKQTDPLFKLRCNISSLISISIKKQGYTKKSRTHQILGCNFETFKKHIERQFTKGMTWENHGEWHLDHIYPVSLAKNEEELIKLNHYTNFQPLWAEDNLRKSNNIEEHQLMMRI